MSDDPAEVTRRGFLGHAAVTGAAVGSLLSAGAPAADAAESVQQVDVSLNVNGSRVALAVDSRVTLLDALRERLQITGTKKGCDRGQCGACTVHIEGRTALSCLTLAIAANGKNVTTVEGLRRRGELHPVQKAFIDRDGFQCGFCTSGQIMSAAALVAQRPAANDDEIREFMSGNICRCAAYPNIVEAVRQARGKH